MEKIVQLLTILVKNLNDTNENIKGQFGDVHRGITEQNNLILKAMTEQNNIVIKALADFGAAETERLDTLSRKIEDLTKRIDSLEAMGSDGMSGHSDELDKLIAQASSNVQAKKPANVEANVVAEKKNVEKVKSPAAILPKTKVEPTIDPLDELIAQASGNAKPEPKPAPSPEPEEDDEDGDTISLDEVKLMFDSLNSGERRVLAIKYLREHDRAAEARIKDNLTWEYCITVGEEDEFANYILDNCEEQ